MTKEAGRESKALANNILKCRDDPKPVFFAHEEESTADAPKFKLCEGSSCSWAKPGDVFGSDKLRPRIEPWLTALCQSEHLSLLLGSGLTHAVHRLATSEPLPGMGAADFGESQDLIDVESKKSAEAAGRDPGNIEDQIRVANELLRGLEILGSNDKQTRKKADALRDKLADVLAKFAASILSGEHGLITANEEKREGAYNYLVSFLMSFASRTGTRDRLHLFTTNYDRLVEMAAEAAEIGVDSRFWGYLHGRSDPKRSADAHREFTRSGQEFKFS